MVRPAISPAMPADHALSRRLITLVFLGAALAPGLVLLARIWSSVEADGISVVTRKLPVVDFANLWAGGVLARAGNLVALFDEESYRAWLRTAFSPRYEDSEWSYPPAMLFLGVPFSLLPVIPAYLLWTAGTAVVLFVVLWRAGLSPAVAAVATLSPAMVQNIVFGQNGALTAALLCAALLLPQARPVAAGIGAGLLTLKPQLGLLLPVVYLAGRAWRAFMVAGAVAIALAAAATVAFGPQVWTLFWIRTRPLMMAVMEAPWPSGHLVNGVSVFFMARSLGFGLEAAHATQGIVTACAVVLAVRAWRMPDADPALRMALCVPLAFLATPYAYTYDLVALGAAVAVVLAHWGWRIGPITALAWLWPAVSAWFGSRGWMLSPLVLAAFAAVAWRALRRTRLRQAGPASAGVAPT
nr:glycosyltransferase family 87 protein [Caldovatus aquaticus]